MKHSIPAIINNETSQQNKLITALLLFIWQSNIYLYAR